MVFFGVRGKNGTCKIITPFFGYIFVISRGKKKLQFFWGKKKVIYPFMRPFVGFKNSILYL